MLNISEKINAFMRHFVPAVQSTTDITPAALQPESTIPDILKQITIVTEPAQGGKPEVAIPLNEYLKTHRMGVFGVITKPDGDGTPMVLMAHRRDLDMWNLPGGGVDDLSAGFDQEVQREVGEETGLTIQVEGKPLLLVNPPVQPGSSAYMLSKNGSTRYDAQMWVAASVTGGALALNDEADGLQWCRLDSLPENTYVRHAQFLESLTPSDQAPTAFLQTLAESARKNAQGPAKRLQGVGLTLDQG